MQEGTGQIYPFPAPTQGRNSNLPLPAIPETFALDLTNLYPTTSGVRKRNGSERMTTNAFTSACEAVMSLNKSDGTSVLIAAGDNDLMTVNLTTFAKTSVKGATTITSNKWGSVNFEGRIFIANGADRVLSWAGTSNFAAAGFTIEGSADDNLDMPFIYGNRLLFVRGMSVFYSELLGVSGVLSEVDFSSLFSLGGKLLFAGSSTTSTGSKSQELCVIVSSEGEVMTFTGDIDSTTWGVEGHYFMPRALGKNAFINMGADLQIITEQGVIPLSDVIHPAPETQKTGRYVKATENINGDFATYAKFYSSLAGWCGLNYTSGNLLIINIPISTTQAAQFVMNTLTGGAWGGPFLGLNAQSWCISDGLPYFGSFDGHVYRFDQVKNDAIYSGSAGTPIYIRGETAFSYCGDPVMIKTFAQVAPLIYSDGGESVSLAINTTFRRGAIPDSVQIEGGAGAVWDTAAWDTSEWSDQVLADFDWKSVEGCGLNLNIVFAGTLNNVDFELLAFLVQFMKGGVGP